MDKMKPAARTAYIILDANGNWHESEHGALLAYTNQTDATNGLQIHGGARVIKYRFLFDGEAEVIDVTP